MYSWPEQDNFRLTFEWKWIDAGCNYTVRITYGRINLKQSSFDT